MVASTDAVPVWIREEIEEQRCAALNTPDAECDFKDGRGDDQRLRDPARLTLEDFQPLSPDARAAKREHCGACRETGRRFDARQLGFAVAQTKGNEVYQGSCVGCFWYDVRQFRADASATMEIKNAL